MQIMNIAAYKFMTLPVDELPQLREALKTVCVKNNLKGTILLSPEGINMILAGEPANIERFWQSLIAYDHFSDMTYKASPGEYQPFKRMLVKIKQEIITLRREDIQPAEFTGPAIAPEDLKRWLDEGRDFLLLDTRNDYEVALGTFKAAKHLDIQKFTDFPEAVERLDENAKKKPVVMFCTGGIRCEKASPVMLSKGFREVYQLDGGILKYFETCKDVHFDGECFVFDQRVGLNGDLEATGAVLCDRCSHAVTTAEQEQYHYQVGEPCPHCPDFQIGNSER